PDQPGPERTHADGRTGRAGGAEEVAPRHAGSGRSLCHGGTPFGAAVGGAGWNWRGQGRTLHAAGAACQRRLVPNTLTEKVFWAIVKRWPWSIPLPSRAAGYPCDPEHDRVRTGGGRRLPPGGDRRV